MGELKTYRAREAGYVDDRYVTEGEEFTTAKPKGKWMALLDDKGNEVPEPEDVPKADLLTEAVAAKEVEIRQRAQSVMDDMRKDFNEKLRAEKARADDAEKLLGEAKAEHEKLIGDADAATDKATQRAEAAEKERDALKVDLEKAKAAPAVKPK